MDSENEIPFLVPAAGTLAGEGRHSTQRCEPPLPNPHQALAFRDTFVLEDRDGNEVAKIQEKKLRIRGTMEIERGGDTVATIHKALVGIRDRFDIDIEDGEDLKARGNVVDHEYEIKRDGDVIASVSKKWLRVRETYGIEIQPGEDDALILAVTVAIDDISRG